MLSLLQCLKDNKVLISDIAYVKNDSEVELNKGDKLLQLMLLRGEEAGCGGTEKTTKTRNEARPPRYFTVQERHLIEEMLQKVKPFIVAYEGIQNYEKLEV
ncbi:hypothetical protein U9M48_021939 [Paspalum notatum var. saurae]|uniref:Uncharacterized protein n=1 Tax=Paspalum notatum var. saurae TaxID=547442 RepID=A0AAQ3TIK1_PASNO